MKLENSDSKEILINRLRRIEGQIQGVQVMLEGERDCREIMQQLSAISSAVKSTSRTFFQDYAVLCLAEMAGTETSARSSELLKEMIILLDKTP